MLGRDTRVHEARATEIEALAELALIASTNNVLMATIADVDTAAGSNLVEAHLEDPGSASLLGLVLFPGVCSATWLGLCLLVAVLTTEICCLAVLLGVTHVSPEGELLVVVHSGILGTFAHADRVKVLVALRAHDHVAIVWLLADTVLHCLDGPGDTGASDLALVLDVGGWKAGRRCGDDSVRSPKVNRQVCFCSIRESHAGFTEHCSLGRSRNRCLGDPGLARNERIHGLLPLDAYSLGGVLKGLLGTSTGSADNRNSVSGG